MIQFKKISDNESVSFELILLSLQLNQALVAKLVDALDLGSSVLRRVGSSPIGRTTNKNPKLIPCRASDFLIQLTEFKRLFMPTEFRLLQ